MDAFIGQLYQQTFYRNSLDTIHSFFSFILSNTLVSYKKQTKVPLSTAYFPLDSFSKLIAHLLKGYPVGSNEGLLFKKRELIGIVLETIGLEMVKSTNDEPQSDGEDLNQKAFVRLSVQLFGELALHYSDPSMADEFNQTLLTIGNFLLEIQPTNVPSFCFGWLELISCKHLLPHYMNNSRLWPIYSSLLKSLFSFFSKLSLATNPAKSLPVVYKGILRFLLVLLHDFSDFLSFYALDLCNLIPYSCVQFRNLVLSAFPKQMKLLDPFGSCVRVDSVPEGSKQPEISSDWKSDITPVLQLVTDAKDEDVKSLVDIIKQHLIAQPSLQERFVKTNCLVTLCATLSISTGKPIYSKLLIQLIGNSDNELRYLLLSGCANHLRYPNTMTTFFFSSTCSIV